MSMNNLQGDICKTNHSPLALLNGDPCSGSATMIDRLAVGEASEDDLQGVDLLLELLDVPLMEACCVILAKSWVAYVTPFHITGPH